MFRVSGKKALGQELKCKIKLLLPDEELEVGYTINSIGQDIFNSVANQIDLLDKDYYGLKLHDQKGWLDLSKSVVKQTKEIDVVVFELRFKYYPAEPALLANESTRYYLYLQLRIDMIEDRLRSDSIDALAYLIACILQSELGDYTENSKNNYVSEFKFVPNQSQELEWSAINLHQNEDFLGLKPADSELNFLKKACQLDTYGIDPFPVKEGHSHDHFLIGVNHLGISTFQDYKLINRFKWDEIERISLDYKVFLIYCRGTRKKGGKIKKPFFGFRSPTQACALNLWKIATEHRYFFTLESTPDLPIVTSSGGIFKKNKLKYIGRVEKDLLKDHVDELRSTGVKRSHSLMSKSIDGPRWQGFQQGNNLQSSLNNIYSSDYINKTLPADMNYFREEEEDEARDYDNDHGDMSFTNRQSNSNRASLFQDNNSAMGRKRPSSASMAKDSPYKQANFTRRSVLTAKSSSDGIDSYNNNNIIRKGSQVYMDTDQRTHDFIKTTIFLILLLISFLFIILLINDSDRPNSITLLVKMMNLESLSLTLRQNYYLPTKSVLKDGLGQLYTYLDSRLF